MAAFDIFSKRQKRIRGNVLDVYSYDRIPAPLRMQIVHVLRDMLGNERDYDDPFSGIGRFYYRIERILCHEYGVDCLPAKYEDIYRARKMDDIFEFLCREQNVEKVLDVVQVCFSVAMDYSVTCSESIRGRGEPARGGHAHRRTVRAELHGTECARPHPPRPAHDRRQRETAGAGRVRRDPPRTRHRAMGVGHRQGRGETARQPEADAGAARIAR